MDNGMFLFVLFLVAIPLLIWYQHNKINVDSERAQDALSPTVYSLEARLQGALSRITDLERQNESQQKTIARLEQRTAELEKSMPLNEPAEK